MVNKGLYRFNSNRHHHRPGSAIDHYRRFRKTRKTYKIQITHHLILVTSLNFVLRLRRL